MYEHKTLVDIFEFSARELGGDFGFYTKNSKKDFEGILFKDVYEQAQNLAIYLIEVLGVQAGERIGLMADNRVEWIITDIAILLAGACDVPRGTDSTSDEVEYILRHSDARVCIVEHADMLKTLRAAKDLSLEKVIVLDPNFSGDKGALVLKDLIAEGAKMRSQHLDSLMQRARAVRPDDLYTIIYTSGTTGPPKGVMLTHGNIAYSIQVMPPLVELRTGEKTLSLLPIWHIFERALEYGAIFVGCSIYYTNVKDLRDDFARVQPDFMASAPRLWESIYDGIKKRLDTEGGWAKLLFNASYEVNRRWQSAIDYLQGNYLRTEEEDTIDTGVNTAMALLTAASLYLPSRIIDQVFFSRIRQVLGGKLRGTVSGGGALPSYVDEFFNVIGIPVMEGYGMTETSPIISTRRWGKLVQGSVGTPVPGTDVRILNDKGEDVPVGEVGVIHVRGPQIMKGYHKNTEATSAALKDGWLNTGDLGFFGLDGTITIKGRAKETIVLLGGENVEPVPIENRLLENDLINQVIVVGQDRKTLGALIWPDKDAMQQMGVVPSEGEDLNQNKELVKAVSKVVKDAISTAHGFKSFEKVTGFRFLPQEMRVGDELTNLLKMKRNVIHDKYADLIDSLYHHPVR